MTYNDTCCRIKEQRIAELEALVAEMQASGRRFSWGAEFYMQGIRCAAGDYVLMRVGPATDDGPKF